ncbi:uncharacterized protein DNG_06344 [Cephalotrichum gorgonifer]|uniref:Uncharacterized protein n=1 Tax=Cephalotrichum gorgonifer TaxID=2041049 RepID=A0AAE8SWD4_9PEZI|nr:uncharacterized protein DNG_06344 [Cephalotrichum gorgonifer]
MSRLTLISAVLLASAHSILAQKTFYENLVLADCGIGLGEGGGSTSREMIYYPGDVWTGNGLETNRPSMMVNVPWTGDYPWGQSGGVKATTPNGDIWRVYINRAIKDPGAAGDAFHTYEPDKPLKCYSYHVDKLYQLDDGKWCSSAYVCNHRGSPYVKPGGGSGGGGGGDGGKDEMRITGSTNSDWVELRDRTAQSVIETVRKTFDNDSHDCDRSEIDIGSGCRISWKCHGDPALKALARMASAFEDTSKKDKFSSKREVNWDVCKVPDTRPGHEGQCRQWVTKTDRYMKMPRVLDVTMDNVPPAGSGRNPSTHGTMGYEITCSKSMWECALCSAIGTAMGVISPGAGAVVSIGCAAC